MPQLPAPTWTDLIMAGKFKEALEFATAERGAACDTDNTVGRIYAAIHIVYSLVPVGKYHDALDPASEAVALARDKQLASEEIEALVCRSRLELVVEWHDEALADATRAVALSERTGDPLDRSRALASRADALMWVGRTVEGLGAARGAAAALDELPEGRADEPLVLQERAHALNSVTRAALYLGRGAEAVEAAEAEVVAAKALGERIAIVNAIRALADACSLAGRYADAPKAALEALEIAESLHEPVGLVNSWAVKAQALRDTGDLEGALDAARAARAHAEGLEQPWTVALAEYGLGVVLTDAQDVAGRNDVIRRLTRVNPHLASALRLYPTRAGWYKRARSMHDRKTANERDLRGILREGRHSPPAPAGILGELHVLRKWASYTAVDLLAPLGQGGPEDRGLIGGGYLLTIGDFGIAIDPGLGFGRALRAADLVPQNINAVVATHHHIDHTGDILPIITCLHEMQEEGAGHDIRFCLAPAPFAAFADVLAYGRGISDLDLLEPGRPVQLGVHGEAGCTVTLEAFRVAHKDLTGRDDSSVGLIVRIAPAEGREVRVAFTGDTRYSYRVVEALPPVDLLVVHVGSVYERDAGMLTPTAGIPGLEATGPWHLGVLGSVELINRARDLHPAEWRPLVLMSEWGEELKEDRKLICEVVAEATGLGVDRVWPADLNSRIALCRDGAAPLATHHPECPAKTWDTDAHENILYLR